MESGDNCQRYFLRFEGLLQAATSDNVQPLAILACERFGATLAICDTTRRKIEELVLTGTNQSVVTFLRATIGYSSGDCASQFVHSEAGIRFLALAAALVTSTGAFHGGLALEKRSNQSNLCRHHAVRYKQSTVARSLRA